MKTLNTNKTLNMMKKMVRGAINIIRKEAATFAQEVKRAYDGEMDDLVTSADKKAQEFYLAEITRNFPGVGIVGEENNLRQPCTLAGVNAYFTLDPLDGTKAFARKQSNGVATMIALVVDGVVIAVCVGDVNTGEVYAYVGNKVPTRIRFGVEGALRQAAKPLKVQYVLLNNSLRKYPSCIHKIGDGEVNGGLFKDMEIGGGSAGLLAARLWKGEIGGYIFAPAHDTPWDTTPIVGMNNALGLVHIKIYDDGLWEEYNPALPIKVVEKNFVEVVLRRENLAEFVDWINR